jgi:hypothetical protein
MNGLECTKKIDPFLFSMDIIKGIITDYAKIIFYHIVVSENKIDIHWINSGCSEPVSRSPDL